MNRLRTSGGGKLVPGVTGVPVALRAPSVAQREPIMEERAQAPLLHQQQAERHQEHACNQSQNTVVPFAVGPA
ncbi:MAG TPA: hypothetical protein PKM08_04680, partial [Syntrophorhabdaceae bacterium]|nr:hypothetical protein [Syntrophorhabdaceae bacterium]